MPYKDKSAARKYRQSIRDRNKNYVKEILLQSECEDCGFSDFRALHFDHIDPSNKTVGIAQLLAGTPSIESIDKEISKCRILCANCHAIKTVECKDYLNDGNKKRI